MFSGSGIDPACLADLHHVELVPREPGAYLARALPGPEVYVLPRWMIDRVAVTLDAIRAH